MHSELTPPYFETDNEDRKGIWDEYAVGGKIQTIVMFENSWSQERTIQIITISYVSASDKRTNNLNLEELCLWLRDHARSRREDLESKTKHQRPRTQIDHVGT